MKSSFDSKSTRKTNKQTKTENVFFWKEGAKRGVVKIAVSILNLFSMLEVRENLKSEELTI